MTDHIRLSTATDEELQELLAQARHAIVRRDIGQAGVARAASMSNRVTREIERRAHTNPFNDERLCANCGENIDRHSGQYAQCLDGTAATEWEGR